MPVYEYNARNRQGKLVNGTLNATSERDLREALREDQLFLTKSKVAFDPDATNSSEGSLFQRIKLRDLVVASRQLATLVRAGIPVNEGTATLPDAPGAGLEKIPVFSEVFGSLLH